MRLVIDIGAERSIGLRDMIARCHRSMGPPRQRARFDSANVTAATALHLQVEAVPVVIAALVEALGTHTRTKAEQQ